MQSGISILVSVVSAAAVPILAVALLWLTVRSRFTSSGRRKAEGLFAAGMARDGQGVALPRTWHSKDLARYQTDSRALSRGFLVYWYVTFLLVLAFSKLTDWDTAWATHLAIAAIGTVIVVALLIGNTVYERLRDERLVRRSALPLHEGLAIHADGEGLTCAFRDRTLAGPWSDWVITDMKFFRARIGIVKCWRVRLALRSEPHRPVLLIDNLIEDPRPLFDLLASRLALPGERGAGADEPPPHTASLSAA